MTNRKQKCKYFTKLDRPQSLYVTQFTENNDKLTNIIKLPKYFIFLPCFQTFTLQTTNDDWLRVRFENEILNSYWYHNSKNGEMCENDDCSLNDVRSYSHLIVRLPVTIYTII